MSRFSNLEFKEGEYEQSHPSVDKDEAYYLAQAEGYFCSGKFEEALRAFSKVLEFNPQNTEAWTAQVRMLIELEEYPEAKLWADAALQRFSDEPELLAAKAVALARMADLNTALAFSDASIEERGDTAYVWLARGDVFLARKEKRAEYCFEKALAFAPSDWRLRWLISRVYVFYAKFSLALKHARSAIELAPDRAIVWVQAGHCQLALGLAAPARHSMEQAVELDPQCPMVREALARAEGTSFVTRIWTRFRNAFS